MAKQPERAPGGQARSTVRADGNGDSERTPGLPRRAPPRQLELIAWENPLGARLGAEFFRELPSAPGVYRMLSREAEVLYVGSSRNLRQRVASYRSVGPARHPRRLCRLVHAVAAIHIEPTETEATARALEASWIRHYRPRFNRVLNRPAETLWIGLSRGPQTGFLDTRWRRSEEAPADWPATMEPQGPFAHRRPVFWLQSLRRTLWWIEGAPVDLRDCPPALLRWDRPATEWSQACSLACPEFTLTALAKVVLQAAESKVDGLCARPWNAPLLDYWEHDREVLAQDPPSAEPPRTSEPA